MNILDSFFKWITRPRVGEKIKVQITLLESAEDEIHFRVQFPPEATDEQICQGVAKIALFCDIAHRKHGGHGLKVESVKVEG